VLPIVAELPAQTELLLPALAEGSELTVIVTELELVQPVAVTFSVNVYVVVVEGLTVALDDEELKPEGLLLQEYVFPDTDAPPIVAGDPEHMETDDPALAEGSALTVTVTELVLEQPAALVSVSV
jgi:hypothetical protein